MKKIKEFDWAIEDYPLICHNCGKITEDGVLLIQLSKDEIQICKKCILTKIEGLSIPDAESKDIGGRR